MPKLYTPKANEYAALIAQFIATHSRVAVAGDDGRIIGFRYV